MQGPGRPDIVNAGSGETGYSECRVLGLVTLYAFTGNKVKVHCWRSVSVFFYPI
ncbi:unnamed protein product [Staurois parvus]|uniref:Uncharacterized protein n=1 Tax=Staurois parvus TaxID=386267 RepID=A0ABN9BSC7_9NEOB|nr:unnamed protein product [Staurois parvus]